MTQESSPAPDNQTLTITDNRTGKTYEVPITHDTIRAMDLRAIKVKDTDFGLMTYDPAFMNTASTRSRWPSTTRSASAQVVMPSISGSSG